MTSEAALRTRTRARSTAPGARSRHPARDAEGTIRWVHVEAVRRLRWLPGTGQRPVGGDDFVLAVAVVVGTEDDIHLPVFFNVVARHGDSLPGPGRGHFVATARPIRVACPDEDATKQ